MSAVHGNTHERLPLPAYLLPFKSSNLSRRMAMPWRLLVFSVVMSLVAATMIAAAFL
jgi:hypothetical protein